MEVIEILKAILFGIVEGITEWLPISSTGHMILLNEFVKLNVSEEFWEVFDVVIQLGAIMAVVVLFWKQIFPFGKKGDTSRYAVPCGPFTVKRDIIVLWIKILISCVPAAVIGILFDDVFTALFYNYQTVAIALIVFGIAFIVIETLHKDKQPKIRRLKDLSCQVALFIGVFQVIAAIFPGTSRSGATIVGALLLGVSRSVAAEFTFFLAIPVMFGASLLKIVKFLKLVSEGSAAVAGSEVLLLLIGALVAYIVSYFVIKFLMGYIKKHDFKVFGWYRIVLGTLVLVYFLLQ